MRGLGWQVESVVGRNYPITRLPDYPITQLLNYGLLRSVIRRFLRDRDVVHVALAEPGGGDANHLRVALQVRDVLAAAVAHPGTQAADQLVNHRGDAAFVRDAALDAFGDQLLMRARQRRRALEIELVLEIAVAADA